VPAGIILIHDVSRTTQGSRRDEEPPVTQPRTRPPHYTALIAAAAILLAPAGCGKSRPKPVAANSTGDSGSAALFSIPPDQMAHLQVLTAEPATLNRT